MKSVENGTQQRKGKKKTEKGETMKKEETMKQTKSKE